MLLIKFPQIVPPLTGCLAIHDNKMFGFSRTLFKVQTGLFLLRK